MARVAAAGAVESVHCLRIDICTNGPPKQPHIVPVMIIYLVKT